MNSSTRLAIIAEMHERELEIIRTKGREYTLGAEEGNDGDTLANLKNVAARTGTSPMQVWAVYFLKHVDAISSYVMDPERPLSEPISGRIDDARTYLGMLECLVREQQGEEYLTEKSMLVGDPVVITALGQIDCDRCDGDCPDGCNPLAGDMPADRIRAGVGLPPEPPEKFEVLERDPRVGDTVRVRSGHGNSGMGLTEGSTHRVKSVGVFGRDDAHMLLQLEDIGGDWASTRFEVIA